ncbi:MAG: RDD family protein [Bacilli bacterium]|nr:RDD family protein [Bacilli bacterium]
MSNKPASLFKRFTAFFIDLILIGIVYFLVTTFIATPISERKYQYNEKIEYLNSVVSKAVLDYGIGFEENGEIIIYEADKYIEVKSEDYIRNNPNIEIDVEKLKNDIYEEYYDKYQKCMESLDNNEEYRETISFVSAIDTFNFIYSVFIGELIFVFFVPFFGKKSQTVGQMLLRLATVNKNETRIKKSKIIIRFLVMFLIETAVPYIFMGSNFIIGIGLMLFVLVFLNPNKQNFHDIISNTKIVEEDTAKIFNTIEEKNAYDKKIKEGK